MSKFILGIGAALVTASAGSAQDMPLFTFVKLGEKWEPTKQRAFEKIPLPGLDASATCSVLTKDKSTVYVGYPDRAAVWAYPMKDGKPVLTAGGPYAPLRIEEGYDNNRDAKEKRKKEPPKLAVTALMIDPAGRIYAGTSKGIQIFDPTGRMCGVLPLPTDGTVEELGWRDDPALLMRIGESKYRREMK